MTQWMPGLTLETIEQMVIEQAFKFYHGNKTQTAISLGIGIRTLEHKLEKYAAADESRKRANERSDIEQRQALLRQRGKVAEGIPGTGVGMRLESVAEVSAQQQMPVSERAEVQEVLPRQATKSREKRASASV